MPRPRRRALLLGGAGLLAVLVVLAVVLGVREQARRLRVQAYRENEAEQARLRAAYEADPLNQARPLEAPPWTANPYEAQPVTHLRLITLEAETAKTPAAASALGVTVAGGRPVLFDCGHTQALGPGFRRLRRRSVFDEWSELRCDGDYVRDAGDGPVVYLLQHAGEGILAFDVVAGSVAWRIDPPTVGTETFPRQLQQPLTRVGDLLVASLSGDDAMLAAFHTASGAVAWMRPHLTAPASDGTTLFALDPAGALCSVDAQTGAVSRTVPLPALAAADGPARLLVHGAELYERTKSALVRIDPSTGKTMWSVPGAFTSAVRGREAIFAAGVALVVHAFDPASGKELWSYGAQQGTSRAFVAVLSLLDIQGSEILAVTDPWNFQMAFFQRGVDAAAPHETVLDVTYPDAPPPPDGYVEIGGERFVLDETRHWQGTLRGRGALLLTGASARFSSATPVLVDLENPAPTTTVVLASHAFHQACARE